jgi:hypothetical protein
LPQIDAEQYIILRLARRWPTISKHRIKHQWFPFNEGIQRHSTSLLPEQRLSPGIPSRLLSLEEMANGTVRLAATDESLRLAPASVGSGGVAAPDRMT